MPGTPEVIRSTADLTPDGILGYAKAGAVSLGAVLTGIAELIPEQWPYKKWLQAAILLCTVLATAAIPNPVKPVEVAPVPVPPPAPPPVTPPPV